MACEGDGRFAATAYKLCDGIKISKNDDREYRAFTLDNGLKVLVIRDKDTDLAAAALSVQVGSFQDNPKLWGQAHALGECRWPQRVAPARWARSCSRAQRGLGCDWA